MLQELNDSKAQRHGISLSGQQKKKEIEMTEWSLIAADCTAWQYLKAIERAGNQEVLLSSISSSHSRLPCLAQTCRHTPGGF